MKEEILLRCELYTAQEAFGKLENSVALKVVHMTGQGDEDGRGLCGGGGGEHSDYQGENRCHREDLGIASTWCGLTVLWRDESGSSFLNVLF